MDDRGNIWSEEDLKKLQQEDKKKLDEQRLHAKIRRKRARTKEVVTADENRPKLSGND